MTRSDNRAALTDEVARFQAEVLRLASAAVQTVLKQELERKLAKLQPAPQRAEIPDRSATAAAAATAAIAAIAATAVTPVTPVTAIVPTAVTAREQPPGVPSGGRKRVPWTREAIINELASWMLSGTAIDATFVTRHGPPGLVAATRRIFGRFDAALNVAGLRVSELYPDGRPER